MNRQLFDKIANGVCYDYNVTMEMLVKKDRDQIYAYPRQLIMYLAKLYNTGSESSIAKLFNRDHATVNHAFKTILNYKDTDKHKKESIEKYETKFKAYIKFTSILDEHKDEINEINNLLSLLELRYISLKNKMEQLKINAQNILV